MAIISMYRIRVVWTGGEGSPYVSTFYADAAGGTAAQAVAGVGTFLTSLKAKTSSAWSYTSNTVVEVVDPVTGQPVAASSVTAITGTGADAAAQVAPFTQGLIRWHTGVYINGRELRGRTFLPGQTVTNNTSGRPAAAILTAWNTYAATFVATLNFAPCIYSRAHHVANLVTSGDAWTEFATLRSRRD